MANQRNARIISDLTRIGILLIVSSGTAWADDCDSILEHGIRNTYTELQTGNFRQAFASEYCSTAYSKQGSTSGTTGGGSAEGYGSFNYSQNSNDTSETRSQNCASGSSSMSNDQFLHAMKSVVDANIVNAWSMCKQRSGGGVIIDGDLNGNTITLHYRFHAVSHTANATILGAPSIQGAQCDTRVRSGSVIDAGGPDQTCTRIGGNPVSVVTCSPYCPRS